MAADETFDAMIQRLLEAARAAQRRAHAPYSRFAVGAAVAQRAHHTAHDLGVALGRALEPEYSADAAHASALPRS